MKKLKTHSRQGKRALAFASGNRAVLYLTAMQLTLSNIKALFAGSAPNTPQVEALGLSFPLKRGWMQRLVGQPIHEREYDRILQMKGGKQWRSSEPPVTREWSAVIYGPGGWRMTIEAESRAALFAEIKQLTP